MCLLEYSETQKKLFSYLEKQLRIIVEDPGLRIIQHEDSVSLDRFTDFKERIGATILEEYQEELEHRLMEYALRAFIKYCVSILGDEVRPGDYVSGSQIIQPQTELIKQMFIGNPSVAINIPNGMNILFPDNKIAAYVPYLSEDNNDEIDPNKVIDLLNCKGNNIQNSFQAILTPIIDFPISENLFFRATLVPAANSKHDVYIRITDVAFGDHITKFNTLRAKKFFVTPEFITTHIKDLVNILSKPDTTNGTKQTIYQSLARIEVALSCLQKELETKIKQKS